MSPTEPGADRSAHASGAPTLTDRAVRAARRLRRAGGAGLARPGDALSLSVAVATVAGAGSSANPYGPAATLALVGVALVCAGLLGVVSVPGHLRRPDVLALVGTAVGCAVLVALGGSATGWLVLFLGAVVGGGVALHYRTRPDGVDGATAAGASTPTADERDAPDSVVDAERDAPDSVVDAERDGPDAGDDVPATGDERDPEAERLLAHLAAFAESGIRPPTRSRMARFGDYPPSAYVERFGSWEAALDAAGVDGDGVDGDDADGGDAD